MTLIIGYLSEKWDIQLNQIIENKLKDVFFSHLRKCGDKYGKKLRNTARKTGIDAAKTASKRVV